MKKNTKKDTEVKHEPIFVNENDLPTIISGQINQLNELNVGVKKALADAEKARSSAEIAKKKSAGAFKKKEAIEELQSASIDIADAVKSQADAQKLSFEFQTKLADISKYLFGLGISNIASNRSVIRELELRLDHASEEELSDLARREILSVVKQLKDQEDILQKQEDLAKQQVFFADNLNEQRLINTTIENRLKSQEERFSRLESNQDKQIEVISLLDLDSKHSEELIGKLTQKIQSQQALLDEHSLTIHNFITRLDHLENEVKRRPTYFVVYVMFAVMIVSLALTILGLFR